MSEAENQPPTLPIKSIDSFGVEPEGNEMVVRVTDARDRCVQLHFPSRDVLENALTTLRQAKADATAKRKARGADDEDFLVRLNKSNVGRAAGHEGVVLMIEPGTAYEQLLLMEIDDAEHLGKALIQSAASRRKIRDATKGAAADLVMPKKPRLLGPDGRKLS